jgi:hypothetical protein
MNSGPQWGHSAVLHLFIPSYSPNWPPFLATCLHNWTDSSPYRLQAWRLRRYTVSICKTHPLNWNAVLPLINATKRQRNSRVLHKPMTKNTHLLHTSHNKCHDESLSMPRSNRNRIRTRLFLVATDALVCACTYTLDTEKLLLHNYKIVKC